MHVAMLAVVVLAASMIPLVLQGGQIAPGAGLWLALPVVVAFVATYVIGQLIIRRILKALTTLNEDGEPTGSGRFEAIDDAKQR